VSLLVSTFKELIMNHCKPHHHCRTLSLSLAVLLGLHLQPCFAGGTVTVCDEPSLRAAMAGGGTVTFECDGTIVLTNTLDVAADTVIDASGHSVVLSGGGLVRIFSAAGVSLSLRNFTLMSGHAAGSGGAMETDGSPAQGGAIKIEDGLLTLVECRFWTNSVAGGAGGNGFPTGSGGAALGGAIYLNGGTLNATNSEFAGNLALGGPGGTNNTDYPGIVGAGGVSQGGAIYSRDGLVSLNNCRFTSNQTIGGRATDSSSGNSGTSGNASGGAIFNTEGTLTAVNSRFSQNQGTTSWPLGPIAGSGGTIRGGAICNETGSVSIAYSEFVANKALGGQARRHLGFAGHGEGGAVFNLGTLELANCIFQDNVAAGGNNGIPAGNGNGGAIFNSGEAQIGKTQFARNSVQAGQGYYGGNNPIVSGMAQGGAILNANILVLTASTLSSNFAHGAEGGLSSFSPFPGSPAFGGALHNTGTCNLTNNTLAANASRGGSWTISPPPPVSPYSAGGDGFGGAIFNAGGTVSSMNNTLAANLAQGGSGYPDGNGYGGGAANTNGFIALANTLIANNTSGSNAFGSVLDLGHNLSSDSSCAFTQTGSINNIDPELGPLDDYGGFTLTMVLLDGSPAIDGGNNANSPSTDQRGHSRPFGSAVDIGAFESSPPYLIRGKISGTTFSTEIQISVAASFTTTTNLGYYTLDGITPGTHSVSPGSPDYLFVPSDRSIAVGPDQLDVDFTAYRWNSLSLDDVANGVLHVVYAATNGQTVRLQTSSDLSQWSPLSTNVMGLSNYWEFILPIGNEPTRFFRASTP
jgi:hypothetical protein